MLKNILGQVAYMISVLFVVLLAGEYFIPEDCYVDEATQAKILRNML